MDNPGWVRTLPIKLCLKPHTHKTHIPTSYLLLPNLGIDMTLVLRFKTQSLGTHTIRLRDLGLSDLSSSGTRKSRPTYICSMDCSDSGSKE